MTKPAGRSTISSRGAPETGVAGASFAPPAATVQADALIAVIQRIAPADAEAVVLELLDQAKRFLGAEHAAFASFVRGLDSKENFRFLLACDPVWCMEYREQAWYACDPWLLYATANTEPACASQIPLRTKLQREVRALAGNYGFVSTYVVPAPSSGGVSRLGVLLLGSSEEGRFERLAATGPLKVLARSLAMELHEWWVRQVRREIMVDQRVTDEDLELLRMERDGLGTKEIADRLAVTTGSVDSRFQRINLKFGTPSRRATARLATEFGLI